MDWEDHSGDHASTAESGSAEMLVRWFGRTSMYRPFKHQLRFTAPLLITAILMVAGGCGTSTPKKLPFDDVRLGMSADDAIKLVGRQGKPYDHDELPVIPLPRTTSKGIPESTSWLVWWNEKTGVAELTLGILDGRVICKEVGWVENGQNKAVRETLPEYQGSTQEKGDQEKLQGTWELTEMVHREMVMPREGIKVIVAGNTMKLVPPEGKQSTEFTFALDPTTKPKAFDRTDPDGEFKGQVYPGIYKFDGDTLKLCIPNKPSKARPTDFISLLGSDLVVMTLTRPKK